MVAVQGDSTLKTPELHITYEGKAGGPSSSTAAAPQQAPARARACRAWSARTAPSSPSARDRRVTSDEVEFDAKADTALFSGNVLVNQQKNVLQGKRLFVDRKTGTQPSRHARRWRTAGRPHRRDVLPGRAQEPAPSQAKSAAAEMAQAPRRAA